ncbi:uncharacterized protein AMSG_02195 [Thecamonas trahens ATCC 50062]|uniref:Uncharacterized protein n=1 Tax=Thecamonas trahens ATCC 50062 TaxID=461836 RepID=A0A0L0DVE1_THETB|nr:hypothetical protein AMSG_02195 [Thecamonas trahens ATCC 50062]KNC56180.1 hypothetical protein AMSG_02195 [Thecamonas trahens ATCC 50062]|eukprot:XP_013761216.1 hypothetical protein AMSG_02195 [Thecamonas trahens ATCC 50062]
MRQVDDEIGGESGAGWGLGKTGKVLLGCAAVTGVMAALAAPFLTPVFRKFTIPYVPAAPTQVRMVLDQIPRLDKGARVVDLGSGDGRVVIAAAKRGAMATGYEINYWLVLYSRWRAWREGVWAQTTFRKADLWKTDLSGFDAIVVFGVAEMLAQMESKLKAELADNAQVIACRFKMPNWDPVVTIEKDHLHSVWVYTRDSINEATGQEKDTFRRMLSCAPHI